MYICICICAHVYICIYIYIYIWVNPLMMIPCPLQVRRAGNAAAAAKGLG